MKGSFSTAWVCLTASDSACRTRHCFFFFTLVTGPRRSVSLKLSDTRVCEPYTRALRQCKASDLQTIVLETAE